MCRVLLGRGWAHPALPSHLQGHHRSGCWHRHRPLPPLSPAAVFFLLFPLQKLSAVEVSELTESSKKNVAHGLAWSYYVGYLKIVLPRT